jgi:hypothetical protein
MHQGLDSLSNFWFSLLVFILYQYVVVWMRAAWYPKLISSLQLWSQSRAIPWNLGKERKLGRKMHHLLYWTERVIVLGAYRHEYFLFSQGFKMIHLFPVHMHSYRNDFWAYLSDKCWFTIKNIIYISSSLWNCICVNLGSLKKSSP